MVAFTHREPGTAEAVWQADGHLATVPELDASVDRLVVIAAHPDDETLGAAGLMARVSCAGGDGDGCRRDRRGGLASRLRRPARPRSSRPCAARRCCGRSSWSPRVRTCISCPPGLRAAGAAERPSGRSVPVLDLERAASPSGRGRPARRRTLVGRRAPRPSRRRRGGRRALRGARHPSSRLPDLAVALGDLGRPCPGADAEALTLTDDERAAKRRGRGEHRRTQIESLSARPGDEPMLHERMRVHFDRTREVFVHESALVAGSLPTRYFDDFYDRHDDPWGFESRWYEKRKREVLMASLPAPRLGRVLEMGCATGLVTAELRLRADTVTAIDAAPAAVGKARRRVAVTMCDSSSVACPRSGLAGTIRHRRALGDRLLLLAGRSRSADRSDRRSAARSADRLPLASSRCGLSSDRRCGASRHCAAWRGWEATVRHEERDFVLEVFERSPARSVAQREGLA